MPKYPVWKPYVKYIIFRLFVIRYMHSWYKHRYFWSQSHIRFLLIDDYIWCGFADLQKAIVYYYVDQWASPHEIQSFISNSQLGDWDQKPAHKRKMWNEKWEIDHICMYDWMSLYFWLIKHMIFVFVIFHSYCKTFCFFLLRQ